MTTNIFLCRIAWMTSYQGLESERPHSGAAYMSEKHKFGHEAYNFLDCGGRVYGYVEHPGSMNLQRLGAQRGALRQDGVTAVWAAPHPVGVYVVGWYQNATVYREEQFQPNDERRIDLTDPTKLCGWWVTADSKDAKLLQADARTFKVPVGKGFLAQSLITYLDGKVPGQEAFRQQLLGYITSGGQITAP
jgi:hypothetical protein